VSSAQTPSFFGRFLTGLPLAILSPFCVLAALVTAALADFLALFRSVEPPPNGALPDTSVVSIVIPNWNGRDLLEKYLPSVVEAAGRVPGSEVLVVDNGSTDGSAQYLRDNFPSIRVIALEHNLGFGGGSNTGFHEAKHDIVVLLNSDMRVEPDFLAPLLGLFIEPSVFSVSCQIFLSDPAKRREETGLTEGWWENGGLRVSHRDDPEVAEPYPCFYGGGGSCAFDRKKFLALGGFDELLAPFYLEDTDIGYLAWKRGWKNFYQPASIVYHEHRGTIGKTFSAGYIQGVLKKNYLLFTWKNIHDWPMFLSHLVHAWVSAALSWLFGESPDRSTFAGLTRAAMQLPGLARSRARAKSLAAISDREAFARTMGGYFHDRFTAAVTSKPSVLFVSPYPISPPIHGGAVFMSQTVRELAARVNLHLIVVLELPAERAHHADLDSICASTAYLVRPAPRPAPASLLPHAAQHFRSRDLLWLIHREIYLRRTNILQFEYTMLAQYGQGFTRIPSILFEHDIYFQSVARRIPQISGLWPKFEARWEYLRALRFELNALPRFDRVQVCSADNARYLKSFLPALARGIDDQYRAGIDPSAYAFRIDGREPLTMLFLGSFRHTPNQEALMWFVKYALPIVLRAEPGARLLVAGSEPPARHSLTGTPGVEFLGFVDDVRDALARYSVFLCPILSGSGVRVKLLEAFAAGIPVVSTHLGAEGLTQRDGEICALADDPASFAQRVIELMRHRETANALAARARAYVDAHRDIRVMTEKLVECYQAEIRRKLSCPPRP